MIYMGKESKKKKSEGNPLALLVGMQIGTTTLENSMEIHFKN